MIAKSGYNSQTVVLNFAFAFCMLTCCINMGCIFYYAQTIKEVESLKDVLQKLTSDRGPGGALCPHGLEVATSHEDYSVKTIPVSQENIETMRTKRETETETARRKCRKRRRCKKGRQRRTPKPVKVAAQFVGAKNTQSSGPVYEYIDFLKPSPWVENLSSPVFFNGSYFTFKASGLHMIYAQILYPGFAPEKETEIIHSRNGSFVESFRCRTGIFIKHAHHRLQQPQTCTIIGIIKPQPGDIVRVKNGNPFAEVDKLKNSVYFGVIQLS